MPGGVNNQKRKTDYVGIFALIGMFIGLVVVDVPMWLKWGWEAGTMGVGVIIVIVCVVVIAASNE